MTATPEEFLLYNKKKISIIFLGGNTIYLRLELFFFPSYRKA